MSCEQKPISEMQKPIRGWVDLGQKGILSDPCRIHDMPLSPDRTGDVYDAINLRVDMLRALGTLIGNGQNRNDRRQSIMQIKVIIIKHGLIENGRPVSNEEVGRELGISGPTVATILKKALARLRTPSRRKLFEDYL